MNTEISVVIPFYNGLGTVGELVSRVTSVCVSHELPFQIIIVDDSGKPSLSSDLQRIFKKHEYVSVFSLHKNIGQHAATFIGILHCGKTSVVTMDEDLKFIPEDIPVLLQMLGDNDLVYGLVPRNGTVGMFREFVLGVLKPMISTRYPKRTSSFRLISSKTVEELKRLRPRYIQMEAMLIQNCKHFEYCEVEDQHGKSRESGYSSLSLYLMISGMLSHYTWVPWIGISIIIPALTSAIVDAEMWKVALMSVLSLMSVINIYGEIKNVIRNRATKKELKRLGNI